MTLQDHAIQRLGLDHAEQQVESGLKHADLLLDVDAVAMLVELLGRRAARDPARQCRDMPDGVPDALLRGWDGELSFQNHAFFFFGWSSADGYRHRLPHNLPIVGLD